MRAPVRVILAVLLACVVSACATSRPVSPVGAPAAPRFVSYPTPQIPAALVVPDDVRRRHAGAWGRLQAGDPRAASREFSAVLKQMPAFYPAETGLGFVHLANDDYDDAEPRFAAAVAANPDYLPAWVGRADALVGLGRDAEAIAALQRVLVLDPSRDGVQSRLELLRFRSTQAALSAGQRARAAGRHDEAVAHFERALSQSPESTMILGELTRTEVALGRLELAEGHARRSIQIEPREAGWQALLGEVLEARGQLREAAEAFSRADMLAPDEAWRTRSRELRDRAELAALPESFRNVATASTITRADVAAFVGIHLRELVAAAPARITTVATDVRTHWAASWILPVTRTGIMTVFPNHTFQPAAVVRRGDLAIVMAVLVQLAGSGREAELSKWQAARPQFRDLAASNVFYPSSALVSAAGVMTPDRDGRFSPTRPATGAELEVAVRRIAAIAGR